MHPFLIHLFIHPPQLLTCQLICYHPKSYVDCLYCRSITRDDLVEYVNKHYSAPRIVLAAAGGTVV